MPAGDGGLSGARGRQPRRRSPALKQHRVDVVAAALDLPGGGGEAGARDAPAIRRWPSIPVLALASTPAAPGGQPEQFAACQAKFDQEAVASSVERLAAAVRARPSGWRAEWEGGRCEDGERAFQRRRRIRAGGTRPVRDVLTWTGLFFGVEVLQVQEVLRYQEMTRVPLAPEVVEGLINLRGQIVTAIDMRRRLEAAAAAPEGMTAHEHGGAHRRRRGQSAGG
jgi:hypothetical protein